MAAVSSVPKPYEEREQYDDMYDLPPCLLLEGAAFDPSVITMTLVDEARLGARAVVLHNVVTADECARIMAYFESLKVTEKCMTRTDYRNNYRVVGRDLNLAAELYRRIQRFVPASETITAANKDLYTSGGLGMEGVWDAAGLNNCFRICKYDPDGHFAPHYDSDYVAAPDSRSFKTFMIYLNADYDAGETNFLHNHQLYFDADTKRFKAPPSAIFASLKAKPGDLLIFDHHLLHEGASVVGGPKYIMRSEIMYQRRPFDDSALTAEERAERDKEQRAIAMVLQAQNLEANRRELEAVELYRKAFKLCPKLEQQF